MNYLASPPLVVAYALAGTVDIDLTTRAARHTTATASDVYLRDIWPTQQGNRRHDRRARSARSCSRRTTPTCSRATRAGTRSPRPKASRSQWDAASTYIKNPPYFDGMTMDVGTIDDIHGARVLGLFGDSITTDHISPAGNIKKDSPAGRFLHGARRAAGRLQQLRLAPRQRRRDGARHLRQHPHQEPDVRRRGRRQHAVLTARTAAPRSCRSTTRR